MYKVDNAVIMAAGMSSRFAPLSYEKPKALISVRGEVLLERQIHQIQEAGISQIILVTGYQKEQFSYLKEQCGVVLVDNPDYLSRNNNSSIFAARHHLGNSYICSTDNYFGRNPFECEVAESYYAAVYADGKTNEWCMEEDESGYIRSVQIGGENAWYMLGHAFWSKDFSETFLGILEREYELPKTHDLLWESIFSAHLSKLPMKIRKYQNEDIYEFDSLDELREFDPAYKVKSGSAILAEVAGRLGCKEGELTSLVPAKNDAGKVVGFCFSTPQVAYQYDYESGKMEVIAK